MDVGGARQPQASKSIILPQMYKMGKIERARAQDLPEFKKAGWKVVPHKAFKNVAPQLVMKMDPVPDLNRKDFKEYVEEQHS